MASKSEIRLIEKITRARMHLESVSASHHIACPEEDPHMAAQCNCGASAINTAVAAALKELVID